jgi:hypothetical protein
MEMHTIETVKKIGRPRKYKEVPVTFGMKITAEEKKCIKQLAGLKAKPANEMIMELVNRELEQTGVVVKTQKITAEELLKMPKSVRSRVIQEQVRKTVKYFEPIEDNQDILDY